MSSLLTEVNISVLGELQPGDSVVKVSRRSDLHAGVVLSVVHEWVDRPPPRRGRNQRQQGPHHQGTHRRSRRTHSSHPHSPQQVKIHQSHATDSDSQTAPVAAQPDEADEDTKRLTTTLLVAVNTCSAPLEGDLEGIAEESQRLQQLVVDKGWWHPGHGNFEVTLETYSHCESDGQYHFVDQYGQVGPAVVKILKVFPSFVLNRVGVRTCVVARRIGHKPLKLSN
jgi:hypothetical protein